MRAFLAVLPPEEVIEHLHGHVGPRRDSDAAGDRDWRWTRPEHQHVTLAFMAALPDWCLDALVADGRAWAARQRPCPLVLGRAGAFPDPGRAKVLWVGVEPQPARAELARWSRALRDLASHAGAQVDGMRLRPHLTVARSGRPRPAGRLVQALDTYQSAAFTVTEVALVQSHLGEGPRRSPRYVVLERFLLG